jgi:nicotinate-nucleotide adenylyltransferase
VRLGLFGGTFDPPHVGHLLAATDALERLELDRLMLVPAARQPLKATQESAAPADRLAMVRRLADGDPRLGVDAVEIERAGLSYTVDTLAAYAAASPGAELFFLVGADALDTFAKWREPGRILALARLVVMERSNGAGEGDLAARAAAMARAAGAGAGREPLVLPTRRVDVSSTEIRARVRAGLTIRGFVPDGVAEYIAAAGLYR